MGQEDEAQRVLPEAANELIKRARAESSPVWIDNGKVTFFHRVEADSVQVKFTTQTKPMKRISGSDVWTCQVALPGADKGMMSYRFLASAMGKPVGGGGPRLWRGPNAPSPLPMKSTLAGSVEHHEFESRSLDESRMVSVYLPRHLGEIAFVVYMSDGDAVESYARVLEPFIDSGELPCIAIVGTHSGVYRGELELNRDDIRRNVRALEYVPSLDPNRFSQHEMFFTQEVISWAEEQYSLPSSVDSRVVFGFSNGGSFAATMGIRHPDLFGSVIACAIAGDRYDLSSYPKLTNQFFLVTGTWDTRFHSNVQYLYKTLKKSKVKCKLAVRVAEHDGTMWQEEFIAAMKVITKNSK
jgi:enterochelin esterase-like enzyme